MEAIIVTSTSAKEIAALVLAVQERRRAEEYMLVRKRCYSVAEKNIARKEVKPCPNRSADPVEDDQGDRAWRRFELHFTAGPERDELYQLLDRLHLSRRELALIVLGLRVRPGFSLDDFDT